MDFPESLEHIGGPAISLADINDTGQIVGQRWNGGPDWNGVFLYESGTFYDIEFPAGWMVVEVKGINNKGQFVGLYTVQVGVDPSGFPISEFHGFVATPAAKKNPEERRFSPAISLSLSQSEPTGSTFSAAMPKPQGVRDLIRRRHDGLAKEFLKSVAGK